MEIGKVTLKEHTFKAAVDHGHMDTIKLFMGRSDRWKGYIQRNGKDFHFNAVCRRQSELVKFLVEGNFVDVNVNHGGRTLLAWVVEFADKTIIRPTEVKLVETMIELGLVHQKFDEHGRDAFEQAISDLAFTRNLSLGRLRFCSDILAIFWRKRKVSQWR